MTIWHILLAAAWADELPGEERWVASDRVAVGLAPDGSIGNDVLELGLLWDPDGPEGEIPLGADLVWQGREYEVWTMSYVVAGDPVVVESGSPVLSGGLEFAWDPPEVRADMTWIHGAASASVLDVDAWVAVPEGRGVAWLRLQFTAIDDVEDLAVARVVDPDFDTYGGSAYTTANEAGDGWAVGEGLFEGRALALAAVDGVGGVCAWCTTPDEVADSDAGPSEGDEQIGVAVWLGSLDAGDVAAVTFAYGMAMGADAAVPLAEAAAADDDPDADGVTEADGDCAPFDGSVAAGLDEQYDGLDNDCDGETDEDTIGVDDDGDGYSELDGDCDDGDATATPGADGGCGELADGGAPDIEVEPLSGEAKAGCGCGAVGGGGLGWLAALAVATTRRRRR